MSENQSSMSAKQIAATRQLYNQAHNDGNEAEMHRHGKQLGIVESDSDSQASSRSESPDIAALRQALLGQLPRRKMNDGSPASSRRSSFSSDIFMPQSNSPQHVDTPVVSRSNSVSSDGRMPPLAVSQTKSKPKWNSSTKIDRPLSDTANRLSTRTSSASVTGKVGSKHW